MGMILPIEPVFCEICRVVHPAFRFLGPGRPPRKIDPDKLLDTCSFCREKAKAKTYNKEHFSNAKPKAIAAYGGKCQICPEDDPRCLVFKSLVPREQVKKGKNYFVKILKMLDAGWFKLVCRNCFEKF